MKEIKKIKVLIKPNDRSFIGRRLVTSCGLVTITHVTSERVIYVTEDGRENWSWLYPNERAVTFEIVATNDKFSKALSLEAAVRTLRTENQQLRAENAQLKRYKKLAETIDELDLHNYGR